MNVSNDTKKSTVQPRQTLPDQLRGIALLGIVFVNMPFLAISNAGLSGESIASVSDAVVAFMIIAFAQGKFYLLFAFLFGYSLTLILRQQTTEELQRYRRRLVGLAVLGLCHLLFFFIGDILLSYALLGLVLLWFVLRPTRIALIGAAVAYGLGLLVWIAVVLASLGAPASSGGIVDNPAALDAAIRGGFGEAVMARLYMLPEALLTQAVLNWFPALAMFLLGLAAGRVNVLARPEEHQQLWRRLLWLALGVGLPAGLASAWLVLFARDPSGFNEVLGVALGFATAPALTGGYVALAALATRLRAVQVFVPAGQMSLTGYLGESILLTALCAGWGFGLYGALTLSQAALMSLGVWLALDVFASLWLRQFAYGPFEWLLRCWSKGQWLPLRRSIPTGAARESPIPVTRVPTLLGWLCNKSR
jgi:uncharacterized protein